MTPVNGSAPGDRRLCLFGDEAGDMTFRPRGPGITRYFFVTTVAFADHGAVQADLQELRHDIAMRGFDPRKGFHATQDQQWVRDLVFDVLDRHDFSVDCTVYDKAKANPALRPDEVTFYESAWFWHLQRVIPDRCLPTPEILVVAAEISLTAKRDAYVQAVQQSMNRVAPAVRYQVAFWPAQTDLCVQAADYCSWAIMRKWEQGDDRSYRRIAAKVGREYDLFARGSLTYY